jgi:hypothetical protein
VIHIVEVREKQDHSTTLRRFNLVRHVIATSSFSAICGNHGESSCTDPNVTSDKDDLLFSLAEWAIETFAVWFSVKTFRDTAGYVNRRGVLIGDGCSIFVRSDGD